MFYLPEFIDEQVDSSTDPLAIMLMREGSYVEAYQMARTQRAGQQQIIEHALIEQRPELTAQDECEYEQMYMSRRERRLNKPSVVITQTEQESDLKQFEARLATKRRLSRS